MSDHDWQTVLDMFPALPKAILTPMSKVTRDELPTAYQGIWETARQASAYVAGQRNHSRTVENLRADHSGTARLTTALQNAEAIARYGSVEAIPRMYYCANCGYCYRSITQRNCPSCSRIFNRQEVIDVDQEINYTLTTEEIFA